MQFVVFLLFGLVAGAIAKFIMPGTQGGGFIMTTILGVIGSFVGGYLGNLLGLGGSAAGFNLVSLATAVGGALLVLFIYGMVMRGKG